MTTIQTKNSLRMPLAVAAFVVASVVAVGCNVTGMVVTNLTHNSARIVLQGNNNYGSTINWRVAYGPPGTFSDSPNSGYALKSATVAAPNALTCGAADSNKTGCFVNISGLTPDAPYEVVVQSVMAGVSAADCASNTGVMEGSNCIISKEGLAGSTFRTAAVTSTSAPALPAGFTLTHKGGLPRPEYVGTRDLGYTVQLGSKVAWMFGDTVMGSNVNGTGEFRGMPSSTIQLGPSGSGYMGTGVANGILPNTSSSPFQYPSKLVCCDVNGFLVNANGVEAFPMTAADTVKTNAFPSYWGRVPRHWGAGAVATVPGGPSAHVFYSSFVYVMPKLADGGNLPDGGSVWKIDSHEIVVDRLNAGCTSNPCRDGGLITAGAPVTLFAEDELHFRPNGLIEGEYVYMSAGVDTGVASNANTAIKLARVSRKNILDRTKYEYWNGSAWGTSVSALANDGGTIAFSGSNQGSMSYNAHLGKYVWINQLWMGRDAELRVASRPQGPWTAQASALIIVGLDAGSNGNGQYGNYFFHEHAELQRAVSTSKVGKVIVFSHAHTPADGGHQNIAVGELQFP